MAVFPDVIEKKLGAGYNFKAVWGISRMRFEAFTLGTRLTRVTRELRPRDLAKATDRAASR